MMMRVLNYIESSQLSRTTLLFLFLFLNICAKDIVHIPNKDLQKDLKASVFLPKKYHSTDKKFPVIYLLHGYSGNHRSWPKIVPLQKYADSLCIIFVCPDGNYDSWYLDSPVKIKSRFESYIIEAVIPFINQNYRVITEAQGRAISGSSMGGHGALTIFCKHLDLFCAASSISGILDLTFFAENWNIKNVLGEMNNNHTVWAQHSFTGTMTHLQETQKPLLIDCGLSDFALDVNRKAHKKLDSLNISHQYYERPGTHSHTYIQRVFKDHIDFLSKALSGIQRNSY